MEEYKLALLKWEKGKLISKMKKAKNNIQQEVRSWISFRTKDDPIRAIIKRQQLKVMK